MNLFCGLQRKQGNKNSNLFSNEDSGLVVRSIRDEKPLHYTLKIQSLSMLKKAVSYSKLRRFESQIFNASGYKWKLALYPTGDKKRNGSRHISLYLVTAEDNILSTTSEINVVFTFLVYDSVKDKYLAIQDGKVKRFNGMRTEWGFEKLISLKKFNEASNGFLVDDCCVFGVDIFIIKCDDHAGNGEVLSLIKQPKDYMFTWKINNFLQLSTTVLSSDVFTVEGYRWRLEVHPKGCSSVISGYLSLFLIFDNMEDLPQDSQVYVEYEMAVLNQLAGYWPIKFSYKYWFEYGGIESWGTPKFMALKDLKEQTMGFICDDAVIVEVKINVLSTLKKFSEEKEIMHPILKM